MMNLVAEATEPPSVLVLDAHVGSPTAKANEPVWLTVVMTNKLDVEVRVPCLYKTPSRASAETRGVTLGAVYRECRAGGAIPVVSQPERRPLSDALPYCGIAPGKTHLLKTDATKWGIEGGWVSGAYRVSLRMEDIQ